MSERDLDDDLHARLSWALGRLEPSSPDRLEAAATLAELAFELHMVPRVAPHLVTLLTDLEPNLRAAACAGLARCKRPEELVGLLAPACHDPNVHVRREAIRSLAGLERSELEGTLRSALEDPDAQVRFEAAAGLAALGDASGLPILGEGTRDRIRRFGALGALARLGHPGGRELALEVLERIWVSEFDRTQAAGLLAKLGDPRGAELLLKRVQKRGADDRGLAMELCGEHRLPGAEAELKSAALDPKDPFQGTAARSLGLLGSGSSRALLVALSNDEAARLEVRCDAMEGLMFLRTRESREDLESIALRARPSEIREAAREALSWLDDRSSETPGATERL